MDNLVARIDVKGTQEFMGKEIPVVEGGFGEGKRCLTDKTIAEIHGMQMFNIRKRLSDNIKRFKEGVDIIDLKRICEINTLTSLGYAKQSITQAEHIYLLSERGYAKLIKIMDTDLAWEIHDKLIDEYFAMRKVINSDEQIKSNLLLEIYNGGQGGVLASKQLVELETKPLIDTIEKQSDAIKEMKPAVVLKETLEVSKDSILVRELAKILKQNGIDMGQNRLFEWLRENGYLIKRKGTDYNMPTQKSMELGLFEIKETNIVHSNGEVRTKKTSKVTGKGQVYFINKFKKVS